jgi:hypothetical protein
LESFEARKKNGRRGESEKGIHKKAPKKRKEYSNFKHKKEEKQKTQKCRVCG